ncbi:hypothetical protein B1A87_015495 [Arthrobacter sp. KBS0703]|uniref:hypothetical protein n=1 Tax=Bacteria TaxID=2 RepID=UPI0011174763|nr:hypothetical protein [Arthrobacter sp. KBS0703]TSE17006.1 hypothetical protein B1A87_015495 [Arthrobacter sp. KBS0703]
METESEIGGTGVTRYEFLVPVSAPEGTLVLEIDQRAEIITGLVGNLGSNKLLGLLAAILVADPLVLRVRGPGTATPPRARAPAG